MNPAVDKLLDEREDQGLPRHVEDEGVLAQVAQLLNVKNADPDSRRSSKTASAVPDAVRAV
jgi:hypothetical protein